MSDSEDDFNEKQLKIVILGEQNVGKTNLVKRFCYDEFSRVYVPTVGADFYIKRITLSGNREINVRITDVSGVELNGHMLDTYLFKVNMVILVYDITSCGSFDSLIIWLRAVDRIMEISGEPTAIVVSIFGNKCDLEHKRSVRLDKTNHFTHDNKLTNYFVSAKTGENVNSSFIELIARYFNVPLSRIEKEKQKFIIKAELIPNSPPKIQHTKVTTSTSKIKQNNLKKTNKNVSNKNVSTTCVIQ